jgi:hypothetical protein
VKRFTATEKWGKEWFQALKPKLKCLWSFICDHADHCGAWEPNFGLASYQIGERVAASDLSAFGDRLHKLPNGKYLVVSFIEFQFGKLSETCPAHKPVFRAMEKNRVTDTLLDTLLNRLPSSLQEEEEEDKEAEAEGAEAKPARAVDGFEDFWQSYPRKAGKGDAEKAWVKLKLASRLPELLTAIRAAKVSHDWTKEAGQYIPHPATWLNRRGWEDQLQPSHSTHRHIPPPQVPDRE